MFQVLLVFQVLESFLELVVELLVSYIRELVVSILGELGQKLGSMLPG